MAAIFSLFDLSIMTRSLKMMLSVPFRPTMSLVLAVVRVFRLKQPHLRLSSSLLNLVVVLGALLVVSLLCRRQFRFQVTLIIFSLLGLPLDLGGCSCFLLVFGSCRQRHLSILREFLSCLRSHVLFLVILALLALLVCGLVVKRRRVVFVVFLFRFLRTIIGSSWIKWLPTDVFQMGLTYFAKHSDFSLELLFIPRYRSRVLIGSLLRVYPQLRCRHCLSPDLVLGQVLPVWSINFQTWTIPFNTEVRLWGIIEKLIRSSLFASVDRAITSAEILVNTPWKRYGSCAITCCCRTIAVKRIKPSTCHFLSFFAVITYCFHQLAQCFQHYLHIVILNLCIT